MGDLTTTLPQRQPSLSETSAPADDELKLVHLFRLGQHYWPKDFSKGQAKEFLKDYLDDLAMFTAAELENACRDWRQNAANKRYPRSAELMSLAHAVRASKANEVKEIRPMLNPRPSLWWLLPKDLWKPHWKESEIHLYEGKPHGR